jgi:hypothetical protein
MKGVPVRVAIGQRDLKNQQKWRSAIQGKEFVPLEGLGNYRSVLEPNPKFIITFFEIQAGEYQEVDDYATLPKPLIKGGSFRTLMVQQRRN